MLVAINGYFLTRPYTGFGSVTIGLIREFAKEKKFKFIVYAPAKITYLEKKSRIKIKIIPEISWLPSSLAKIVWEQWQIPRQAMKDGAKILHHLYPVYSLFGKRLKQITCIHDVIPWQFPERYQYSFSGRILRKFIIFSSRRAEAITTVSKTSKQAINKYFGIKKSRIKAIYNGISPKFYKKPDSKITHRILANLNLKQNRYILYVGGFESRKRVAFLVDSFSQIAPKIPYQLVIPGSPSPQQKINRDFYQLPAQIERLGLAGRVRLLGRVSENQLVNLYRGAKLFVTATKAEGFNLPVAEAMATSTAVLASDASATREIATNPENGEVAIQLIPLSASRREFARALLLLIKNSSRINKLKKAGLKVQARFRWSASASKVIKLYKKLIGT